MCIGLLPYFALLVKLTSLEAQPPLVPTPISMFPKLKLKKIAPTFLMIDPEAWSKPIYMLVQSIVLRPSIRDVNTEGALKANL